MLHASDWTLQYEKDFLLNSIGIFLSPWDKKVTMKCQVRTSGPIHETAIFTGKNGWTLTISHSSIEKPYLIWGLHSKNLEHTLQTPQPAVETWQAIIISIFTLTPEGTVLQGAHSLCWNKFTWLDAYGQFEKFTSIIYLIPQIPRLVNIKGKSIWLGHGPEKGKCSWQVLQLKFLLKPRFLKLSSFWGTHVNYHFNVSWKRLITPPNPTCWNLPSVEKLSLNPACILQENHLKVGCWVRLFEAYAFWIWVITDVSWWAHNDSPRLKSWT